MRQISKDIEITIDGSPVGFRLSKLDAFSGVMLLRLLMRLENQNTAPTMLDLIASLSEDELRSVMKSVFNHISVLLPAGPHPVMTGDRACGYCPVTCPNIDEFLFLPVAAGMWRQHELWDGTYTLDDLLDIVELIRVRRMNEARASDAVRA